MKRLITLLVSIPVSVFVFGCASPRSNTQTQFGTNQLFIVDNLESASGPAEHGLETAALELAVKLGVKAAKAMIEKEAKRYESSYAAARTTKWQGVARLANDSLSPDWTLASGKILVLARTVTNQAHGLVWRWDDAAKRSALIEDIVTGSVPWISNAKERESIRTTLDMQLPKAGYPTFVGTFVVAPHPATKEAMNVSLLGYMYSALSAKRSAFHIPFTKWDEVDSAIALRFSGPEGQKGYGGERYESGTVFVLHRNEQSDFWKPMEKGKQMSNPLAIPGGSLVTTQVKIVESSEMKKRLEQVGVEVGKVTPKSLGIGK